VNYYINKRFVFKDERSFTKSAFGYLILAAAVLLLDTILLFLSVEYLFHNKAISKLIIEALLFLISWSVQHYVIFPNQHKKELSK
jgi:dolichol-phosphate mannosyltransferase